MFLVTKQVLTQILERGVGAIVNVASGAGYGSRRLFAYGVSKSAVFKFTTALARDDAAEGIGVNMVVPGFTRSGMTEDWAPAVFERGGAGNVAGRVNEPQDVASAVLWLASDEASTISGTTIGVGTLPRTPQDTVRAPEGTSFVTARRAQTRSDSGLHTSRIVRAQ